MFQRTWALGWRELGLKPFVSLKFVSGKCRPSREIARTKRDVLAKCLASCLASSTDMVNKNNRIEIALTYIKHFSCSRYGIRYLYAVSHFFLISTLRFALLLPPLHRVGHWSQEKWNNLPRFKPSGLSTAWSSEERCYHERHHFPPSLLEPNPMSTHIPKSSQACSDGPDDWSLTTEDCPSSSKAREPQHSWSDAGGIVPFKTVRNKERPRTSHRSEETKEK